MKRLPMNARTHSEVFQYYQTRALQLASESFVWDRSVREVIPFLYVTEFFNQNDGKKYGSFYITADGRGRGLWEVGIQALGGMSVVTVDDCHVADFLKSKNIDHVVVPGVYDAPAYKLVEKFYGDQVAKRSQVFLMNHIDEGVVIMKKIGASDDAIAAYCLHPLLQGDADLVSNLDAVSKVVTAKQMALAIEYRQFANSWLSAKVEILNGATKFIGLPSPGPLAEVRDMLIADKVQNYKDFIVYHRGTHQRSAELDIYFRKWMEVLNIDNFDDWYKMLVVMSPKHNRAQER